MGKGSLVSTEEAALILLQSVTKMCAIIWAPTIAQKVIEQERFKAAS